MVLDEKSSQEYPVHGVVPRGSILGPTLFHYTLMTFLMKLSLILLSMLMIVLSILIAIKHLICGNNQSCLLHLNLTYKTLDWRRKCVVDFNARKT